MSLPWTGDMGAFSFSGVDTKGDVGCVGPEKRTRVNLVSLTLSAGGDSATQNREAF